MFEKAVNLADKAAQTVDKMLPIAYDSDKSDELGPLLLELKGLVIQIKASVKNASGQRSSLPLNR